MAISLRGTAAGWSFAASGSISLTPPTHVTGDMLLARVAYKSSAIATCAASTSSSGWAKLGEFHDGTTNSGNGTGSVAVAVFWKVATSGSEANLVVTFSQTVTQVGHIMMVYQKAADPETWDTPVGDGGGFTASTSVSATIQSHVTVKAGDMVDFFYAARDDSTATVPTFTQTGVTYAAVSEQPATAGTDTSGADGAYDGGYRLASSGTSSASAVVTGTLSTSESGSAWTTRLRVFIAGSFTADAVVMPRFTADAVIKREMRIFGGFPTVKGTATSTDSTETGSHTINLPANIGSGDLLIAVMSIDGNTGSSWPAGWTSIVGQQSSAEVTLTVRYRFADGSEGATITVTSTSKQATTRVFLISGHDSAFPPERDPNAGTSATPDVDLLTPATGGVPWGVLPILWLACEAANTGSDAEVTAYPTNYSNNQLSQFTGSGSAAVGLGTATRNFQAGTDGPDSFTIETSVAWSSARLAVHPSGLSTDAVISRTQFPARQLAADDFNDNQTDSWGSADVGGSWTNSGSASNYDKAGGIGIQSSMAASADRRSTLTSVLSESHDITARVRTTQVAAGGVLTARLIGRHFTPASDSMYRFTAIFQTDQTMTYAIERFDNGTFGEIASGTLTGLTHAANTWYWLRLQIDGSGPTNLRIKAWQDGSSQPGAWNREITDSMAGLQNQKGGVGLWAAANSAYSGASYSTEWDDLNGLGQGFITDAVLFKTQSASFAADAFIQLYFRADAVIAAGGGTVEVSFTTNAIVRKEQSVSFAANAVIKREQVASLVSNAVIQATIAVSFTANAVLFKAQSASFSANAILRVARSATIAADAVILRTQTAVLTADAIIMPIFRADAIVRKAQSAALTADAVIKKEQTASFTGNAVVLRTQPASLTADAVILRTQTSSLSANAVILRTQSAALTADAAIVRTIAVSFTSNAVLRATISAAYTANAVIFRTQTASLAADAVLFKVQSQTFTADAVLRIGRTASFTADAVTRRVQAPTLASDAVIFKVQTRTLTADAVIMPSFRSDAVILRTQTASLTADAIIMPVFRADAILRKIQAASFTADAFVQGTGVVAFSADAVLFKTQAATLTGDAVLLKTQAVSFTANAVLFRIQTAVFTSDAVLKREQVASFTTNAVIKREQIATLTADAVIYKSQTATFTSDAITRVSRAASITADAIILKTQAAALTANAVLFRIQTASLTADAVIMPRFAADAIVLRTQTATLTADAVVMPVFRADAILRKTQATSFTADAFIFGAGLTAFTADAVLRATISRTFTADAIVLRTQSATFTANAVIFRTQAASLTADAVLRREQAAQITANAVLLRSQSTTLAADAVLLKTQSASFTADAFIQGAGAVFFTTNAVIRREQATSVTADAIVRIGRAASITADAMVLQPHAVSITADAVLFRTQTANLTGNAVLRLTRTASLTADAFFEIVQTRTFTADAVIVGGGVKFLTVDAVLTSPFSASYKMDAWIALVHIGRISATITADTIAATLSVTMTQRRFTSFTANAVVV